MGSEDRFTPSERRGMPEYLADRRIVFAVAYLGYAVCYLVRNNLKLAASPMAADLGIGTFEIGVLLSAFTVAYAPGKLLLGMAVDRLSMRGMLAGCVAASAILCFCIPFLERFPHLLIAMTLLGFVQGAGSPAALGMIGTWYPNKTRATAVTAWNTSQNLGAAILAVVAVLILDYLSGDWRLIFWIPATISAVVAVLLWRYGRDRPWQEGYPTLTALYGRAGIPRSDVASKDSYWRLVFSAFTSSRVLLLLLLLNALMYFIRFGIINWMTIYLPHDKGFTLSQAQNIFAALEFMAIPFVAVFAFLAWKFPSSMSVVGAVSMLAFSLTVLCYGFFDDAGAVSLAAAVLGGLIYAPQVIVNVLTLNLMPPRMIGAAVGFVGLSGYLLGELAANLLVPLIAHYLGWGFVNFAMAGVGLIALWVYLALRPYERRAVIL